MAAPAPAKKGAVDLALVLGAPKGKPGAEPESDPMAEEESSDELDPAFESAAVEAFPELAEDPARLAAVKRMIEACKGSY